MGTASSSSQSNDLHQIQPHSSQWDPNSISKLPNALNHEKPRYFGIPLLEVVETQLELIPLPVADAIKWLNKTGLKEEGLYRIPGNLTVVDGYIKRFDNGEKVDLSEELCPENLTSIVVQYIKRLPHSLLSSELKPKFYELKNKKDDMDEELFKQALKGLISQLPPTHRELLYLLSHHFSLIALNAKDNKMNPQALATTLNILFGKSNSFMFNYLIENDNYKSLCPSNLTFGVTITEFNSGEYNNNGDWVHPVLLSCFEYIEDNRYAEDLYIIQCSVTELKKLRLQIDSEEPLNFKIPSDINIDVVSGLVREFIWELPVPIFYPHHHKLREIMNSTEQDEKKQLNEVKEIFMLLLPIQKSHIIRLSQHISKVIQNSPNKIDLFVLCRSVFGSFYEDIYKYFVLHISEFV